MCKIGLDLYEILTDIKQNSLTIRGGGIYNLGKVLAN